jgi:hypothetical protein
MSLTVSNNLVTPRIKHKNTIEQIQQILDSTERERRETTVALEWKKRDRCGSGVEEKR